MPVGVVPSPSRWCADSPLRPTRARHGPRTRLPHSRTTSVAVVERAVGAVTWIRCGQPCSASARARVSMRVLCRVMAALPPFHVAVAPVTAAELGASWHQGCPVGPAQLRTLHVSYVGFDGRAHSGAIVVNRDVTGEVTTVFRRLYAARFPIRRMEPIAKYGGSDPRSMAADNTSGVQLPLRGRGRSEALVGARLRRGDRREHGREPVRARAASCGLRPGARTSTARATATGMAVAGGVLVRAFASVGWLWGGRWTGSPDYQHFSRTGG